MKHSLVKPIAAAIALVFAASGVAATAQDALKLEGAAYLMTHEVDDQGNSTIKLVAPDIVVPGDRILFATTYENVSTSAVTNFVVTNPVPPSVQLAADADPELIVSVDGGATWGVLRDLTVPAGAGSTRPATAADVTHLRWVIAEIAPNGTGKVEYIATVR